jgi:ADP-ribose pyrophosphatase YjhB (NUDIX family)
MLKESVATVIPHRGTDGRILLVQRPTTANEELPGVWGLPAASLRQGEDDFAALKRIGRQKLGRELTPLRMIAQGRSQRSDYDLDMRLYQALLGDEPELASSTDESVTLYTDWRWGKPEDLRDGAAKGSLCCQLAIDFLDHVDHTFDSSL